MNIHHFYEHPGTDYFVKAINYKHRRTLQRIEKEVRDKMNNIQKELGVKGDYKVRAEIQITMTNIKFIKKLKQIK